MAVNESIRVMVSSRSLARVFEADVQLGDMRRRLQDFVSSVRWSAGGQPVGRDQPIFNVWIHEDEPGLDAGRSTLQISLDEVDRADVVLVLYTGEAGSASPGSPIGICHAELQAAIARRPEIVFMIGLLPLKARPNEADKSFRRYVEELRLFQKDVSSETELHAAVASMLQNVVARLAARWQVRTGWIAARRWPGSA